MSALGWNPLLRASLYAAILAFSTCFALPSSAAEAEPAAEAAEEAEPATELEEALIEPAPPEGVEEMVVTRARRRVENVQTVPIPISILSGEFLDKTGTWNIARLVELEPSLRLYTSNPRNTALNIRGYGAPFGLTNDGIEPGVGLYVDDVFYARPASAVFDFIDVDQVEVLRGPQGTLYGKNTTAGAVNLRTRAPSFEPEARGEISVGRFSFVQAKTSVSGPLVADTLAARFSLTTTQRDGYVTNVTTNADVNDLNNIGFRGQLLWLASDDLRVTVYGDYNLQRMDCCTQVIAGVAPTLRNPNRQFFGIIADLDYTPPTLNGKESRVTDVDSPLQANTNLGGTSVNLEWEVGDGTLTSVSAWRIWQWYPSNDRDFIGLPVTTVSANPSEQTQWTQEIRYAAESELPELPYSIGREFDYVAGLFFFHQSIDSQGAQEQGSAASRYLLAPAPGVTSALLDGLRADDDISLDTTSFAVFGQATWQITEKLGLTPGLRLNYDAKSGSYVRTVTGGQQTDDPALIALQNSILSSQSFDVDFSAFDVSGLITTSYALTDDVFGFFTWARAFKSGGVNIGGLPNLPDGQPALALAEIDPEKVNHLELGVKTTLFDDLTANLTLFQSSIDDYQTQVVNAQVGVLRGYLANADEVRVRGVEGELVGQFRERVDYYTRFAYTDGEYVSFPDAPCPLELTGGPQQNCDISGQDLPGIPDWALSFGSEYHFPAKISVFPGELYIGTDVSYQTSFSSSPSPSLYMNVGERWLANFRGGFRSESGWGVFGWVRNAFDNGYYEFLSAQPGNSGMYVGQVGDPMTYGLTLQASF